MPCHRRRRVRQQVALKRVRLGVMFEDLRHAVWPVLKFDAEAEDLTAELPA